MHSDPGMVPLLSTNVGLIWVRCLRPAVAVLAGRATAGLSRAGAGHGSTPPLILS